MTSDPLGLQDNFLFGGISKGLKAIEGFAKGKGKKTPAKKYQETPNWAGAYSSPQSAPTKAVKAKTKGGKPNVKGKGQEKGKEEAKGQKGNGKTPVSGIPAKKVKAK